MVSDIDFCAVTGSVKAKNVCQFLQKSMAPDAREIKSFVTNLFATGGNQKSGTFETPAVEFHEKWNQRLVLW